MAKKKPKFIRTTISVPAAIKEQMEMASDVNWSAVASAAFAAKLAQLPVSKKRESFPLMFSFTTEFLCEK